MVWFQFIALVTRETTDRNYPSKNMGGKTMTIVRSEAFVMAGSHQDHSIGRYPCNSILMGNLFQFSFPHVAGLWWRPWLLWFPSTWPTTCSCLFLRGRESHSDFDFQTLFILLLQRIIKRKLLVLPHLIDTWPAFCSFTCYPYCPATNNWVKIINRHFIKRAQSAVLK